MEIEIDPAWAEALDGIEEFSNRFSRVQASKLLGVLPAALIDDDKPRPAVVFSFGAGVAAVAGASRVSAAAQVAQSVPGLAAKVVDQISTSAGTPAARAFSATSTLSSRRISVLPT